MATKTATRKKTTTTKKPSARKASSKSDLLPIGIYKENHPEKHIATGKYKVFFVIFGVLMVAFAALAVYLFIFSSNLLNEYEKAVECQNSGVCNTHVKESAKIDGANITEGGNGQ